MKRFEAGCSDGRKLFTWAVDGEAAQRRLEKDLRPDVRLLWIALNPPKSRLNKEADGSRARGKEALLE